MQNCGLTGFLSFFSRPTQRLSNLSTSLTGSNLVHTQVLVSTCPYLVISIHHGWAGRLRVLPGYVVRMLGDNSKIASGYLDDPARQRRSSTGKRGIHARIRKVQILPHRIRRHVNKQAVSFQSASTPINMDVASTMSSRGQTSVRPALLHRQLLSIFPIGQCVYQ